jgi:four helix bundle protein
MLKQFQTYQLALQFYRLGQGLVLPTHLKNQFARCSSSIALNVAEGSGRVSLGDKRHFYSIALGSLRESQAVLDLANPSPELVQLADRLGACLWRLTRNS